MEPALLSRAVGRRHTLVGATLEQAGFDERTTVAGVRDLLDAACEIAPHTWTAGFSGARVGLRPGTTDDLPILGPSTVVPALVYRPATTAMVCSSRH